MCRVWLPTAQQAVLLVSVRTHVPLWLPVTGKGWFSTAVSLAKLQFCVSTLVVYINKLFPFGFLGSDPSPDNLQTDASGGPAEKTGGDGTNLEVTPPSDTQGWRRHCELGKGRYGHKSRADQVRHWWHNCIWMCVLRRTDDQVHRQAFHWSREIWAGEGQLALNSYMLFFWDNIQTHHQEVGLHHSNDQPGPTGYRPLHDACCLCLLLDVVSTQYLKGRQCLCTNIMAQDIMSNYSRPCGQLKIFLRV